MERHIFCRVERAAFETIYKVTTRYGAHVFPHLRIREVANRDWIDETDFDFALKGHIDFTIAQNFKPVLALELDGHFHHSAKTRERDRKKDAVCDSLGIPLVRLDYGDMRPEAFQPILTELIESWLEQGPMNSNGKHAIQFPGSQLPPASLEILTSERPFGYIESLARLKLNGELIQMGKGRVKVPPESRVCGRLLAEKIAVTHAAHYLKAVVRAAMPDSIPTGPSTLLIDCKSCLASPAIQPFVATTQVCAEGMPSLLS